VFSVATRAVTMRISARLCSSASFVAPCIVRPLRSVLYVPADNSKALLKSANLPADAVLIDLEDGCRDKSAGRANAVAAIKSTDFGRRRVVLRVNGRGSPEAKEDAKAAAAIAAHRHPVSNSQGACCIAVPKVETVQDLSPIGDALAAENAFAPLWAVVETPRGILSLAKLCEDAVTSRRSEDTGYWRLEALVAGTSDLTKDLRARQTHDRLPLVYSLSAIVLAARAFGLAAIDGVHLDLSSNPTAIETFRKICVQGRDLGKSGFFFFLLLFSFFNSQDFAVSPVAPFIQGSKEKR
jgi:citrate lyase subunit beta / citryl-CoA lyase